MEDREEGRELTDQEWLAAWIVASTQVGGLAGRDVASAFAKAAGAVIEAKRLLTTPHESQVSLTRRARVWVDESGKWRVNIAPGRANHWFPDRAPPKPTGEEG